MSVQAFINTTDLEQRFGTEYIQDCNTAGKNILIALSDANSLVQSYLQSVYVLPFAEVPALIKSLAADIARFKNQPDSPDKEAVSRYQLALNMLQQIRDKAILLDAPLVPTGPAPEPEDENTFSNSAGFFSADIRLFTRGTIL